MNWIRESLRARPEKQWEEVQSLAVTWFMFWLMLDCFAFGFFLYHSTNSFSFSLSSCPFVVHLLLFITRKYAFIWVKRRPTVQREDTFISAKKRTFAHKSDSILINIQKHFWAFICVIRHTKEKNILSLTPTFESLTSSWKSLETKT